MTMDPAIVASTEEILERLRAVTGRLQDGLDRYLAGGGTSEDLEDLGEELEDLEVFHVPPVGHAMHELVEDIANAGIDKLEEI